MTTKKPPGAPRESIFGHPPTSVIRTLARASDYWNLTRVRAAITAANEAVELTDSTIRAAISSGRRGNRTFAPLSDAQVGALKQLAQKRFGAS